MLHHTSLHPPGYRFASALRLVFWVLCLTLGGIGLHTSQRTSQADKEVSQLEQTDFMPIHISTGTRAVSSEE